MHVFSFKQFYNLKILEIDLGLTRLEFKNRFILLGLVTFSLWFGLQNILNDTLYWCTGGFYIYCNLLMLLFIYVFLKYRNQSSNISVFRLLTLLVIAFFAGNTSHNIVTAIPIFIIVQFFVDFLDRKRSLFLYYSISLTGFIAGGLIVLMSPGNLVRMERTKHSFNVSVGGMYLNYKRVLQDYLSWSLPLYLSIAILFILVFIFLDYSFNFKLNSADFFQKKTKHYWIKFILKYGKYLLTALLTLIPFIIVRRTAGPRTSFFFMTLIFLFLNLICYNFLSKIIIVKKNNSYVHKFVFSLLSTALIIIFFLYHLVPAYEQKIDYMHRERIVEKQTSKDKDIVFEPLKQRSNTLFKFRDMSEDKWDPRNYAFAKYYGIKSVRVIENK